MATLFSILKFVLSVSNEILLYMNKKQLLDAGQQAVIAAILKQGLTNVQKANAARDSVDTSPDSLRNDPFNTD